MTNFFYGVSATASFLAALLFLRFWRECEDRLFVCFAVAFALLAVNWVALSVLPTPGETRPSVYVIRLGAFVVVLGGVIYKIASEVADRRW